MSFPSLHLPTLNAILNAGSAFFLVLGFLFIKRKRVVPHRAAMLMACLCSTVFLVSYLLHHARHGSTRFLGEGAIRWTYFSVLFSHTLLALAVVPLVLVTLTKALRGQVERHRQWARWTWPVWMYVSITGVVIYGMLYHL